MDKMDAINTAAELILSAKRVTAFTGAGISVESGIPPFRGQNGLWSKYNPIFLDIDYFQRNPTEAWKLIKEIFYDYFGGAKPNAAHKALAEMEEDGWLHSIITQNIDNLHQEAGSKDVVEYHGTSQRLTCLNCGKNFQYTPELFDTMPPVCPKCGGLLKPDFVFFGEPIPLNAQQRSLEETLISDVWLVIGTTGEIMPASMLPYQALQNGATILEINIQPSNYTREITKVFLEGKATVMMEMLLERLSEIG